MADTSRKPYIALDIVEKLQSAQLWEKFMELPPSHAREYLKWIDEAKKPETRANRLQKVCEMIASK